MTKRPTINTLTNTASPTYLTQLNQNFTNVKNQFDNTLSLDGSLPNAMNADLDLNGNDLINGGTLSADDIVIGGTSIGTQVSNAAASATSAATSASSASASATTATAYTPAYFNNFAALKADTRSWPVGQLLNTRAEGFAYQVVSSGEHVTTTGGTKLIVLPGDTGYNVKAFGAIGDWNGTTGTNDTSAIQTALNQSLLNGSALFFPSGRYRTTAPLTIDKSASSLDPTDGGKTLSIRGSGPASCQIASDHNGVCLDFTGGASAGWHTYFYVDGIGITKANKGRNAGSIGLSLDDCAFAQFQRFDISYFEYGIFGEDVLSSAFVDGTVRLNNYGWRFAKGTRSHPNNISFRGVTTLNNQIWGGQLIQPSLFDYIGGSIESNGYTGTPGDTSSWGVDIDNGGTEGSVAVNFIGVYIENNNGRADVKILSDTKNATYNFNGCSFLRFTDITSRFATNNIFFNSITESRLVVSGCGFKDFAPYTSSAARSFIAAGDAQVIDAGGNIFLDTASGNTGIERAIFSPLGTNHQLPFASLPDVVKYRNGIQYCSNGTGAALPSLAVSDGVKWSQIPLGIFGGRVSSAGASLNLPRGWSCSRASTGVYTITHNLTLATNTYAVTATPSGASGRGYCSGMVLSGASFEIYFANTVGVLADMDFNFTMITI
jgi:hypothetical protein